MLTYPWRRQYLVGLMSGLCLLSWKPFSWLDVLLFTHSSLWVNNRDHSIIADYVMWTFQIWQNSYTIFGRLAHLPFLLLYAGYVVSSWYIVFHVVHWLSLPPVFKVISSIETVSIKVPCCMKIFIPFPLLPLQSKMRITMKSYSFVRENAYKVLYPWSKDDDCGPAQWYAGQMHPKPGSFSQYFYFIFAPTLLYRDFYPRYYFTKL